MIDPDTHLAVWKLETAELERRIARGVRSGRPLAAVLAALTARQRDRRSGAVQPAQPPARQSARTAKTDTRAALRPQA